jgi:hypothetical protein
MSLTKDQVHKLAAIEFDPAPKEILCEFQPRCWQQETKRMGINLNIAAVTLTKSKAELIAIDEKDLVEAMRWLDDQQTRFLQLASLVTNAWLRMGIAACAAREETPG